ncbi:MAG TPA: alpha-E domain-containing protein, partial [Tepidisphaeraceae bacterium]|nr:alpha-E domain-containing protein [Tepidisphaeraceae bacterium]
MITTPQQVPGSSQAALLDASMLAALSRPVLARDADATYWMSRYIERAEHVARLLLVNSEALIDIGDVAEALLDRHWQSILKIMNIEPMVDDADEPLSARIAQYMTFDHENVNSLIRCLTRARENARGIREVISSEMWEQLNKLYWSIRSDEAQNLFRETPDQFYQQIIVGSMLFQGLTDQTLMHGQRWYFTQLGKYFERIMVTCRTLATKYEILSDAEWAETPLVNIHWSAVLRSCGSIEAYRRTHLGELDLAHIAQFLILQEDFPRSVRYCVKQAHEAIASIRAAVRPRGAVDPAERILGRLDAQLEYAEPVYLLASG